MRSHIFYIHYGQNISGEIMKNNPPIMFKEGINVLMLIDRGVQNSNKGSKRWINKIITSNPLEWDKAAETLIELQNHLASPDVRLYASLNPRNLTNAIKTFKHKQLDLLAENEVNFYRRINDSFCSCLMQPENRERSLFLLDCDTPESTGLLAFTNSNRDIKFHYMYPTPNGWHAILDPFNPQLLEGVGDVELKKDALILINWLDLNCN